MHSWAVKLQRWIESNLEYICIGKEKIDQNNEAYIIVWEKKTIKKYPRKSRHSPLKKANIQSDISNYKVWLKKHLCMKSFIICINKVYFVCIWTLAALM